jgi:hypothetical protein
MLPVSSCDDRPCRSRETDSRQAYWAMGLSWLELAARIELIAAR